MPQQLKDAKIMGGIGAILLLLAGIPRVGFLLGVVGIILILLALRKIADITGEKRIFSDYLKSVIFYGIAMVLAFIVGFAGAFSVLRKFSPTIPLTFEAIKEVFGKILLALVLFWLFGILSGYFVMSSFKKVAEVSGEKIFATAGVLTFVGNILVIILIGILIGFIANILTVVAFFSLPEELKKKSEVFETGKIG